MLAKDEWFAQVAGHIRSLLIQKWSWNFKMKEALAAKAARETVASPESRWVQFYLIDVLSSSGGRFLEGGIEVDPPSSVVYLIRIWVVCGKFFFTIQFWPRILCQIRVRHILRM